METVEKSSFEALFCKIFQKNNLHHLLEPQMIEDFYLFTNYYLETNAHTNLSAIRDLEGIISKHYADCLLAERLFPQGATVLDIGCGGGFPTFPLAIARKDLQITAVDSTGKKIAFVESTAKAMKLSNIHPICARIEEERLSKHKEQFDVVTSRAVAALPILTELAMPFVKIGGKFIALKGAQGKEELESAKNAILTLGGTCLNAGFAELQTETGAEGRYLIEILKDKPTNKIYPRVYTQIVKKPL